MCAAAVKKNHTDASGHHVDATLSHRGDCCDRADPLRDTPLRSERCVSSLVEACWQAVDFGRDVLEGILEHDDAGIPLARRRKEPFERLQQRVVAVTKAFAPYDWTKQM